MPKASDYAIQLERTYRYPYDRVRLEYDWDSVAARKAMLSVELGHLIKYKDTDGGTESGNINEWLYVEHIDHQIPPTGREVPITVVTLVPSYLYRDLDRIRWDNFNRADPNNAPQRWTVGTQIVPITVPAAAGNPAPTYAVVGSLPTGLSFNPSSRVISGTPTAEGSGTITIRATNSQGNDDYTVTYSIVAV